MTARIFNYVKLESIGKAFQMKNNIARCKVYCKPPRKQVIFQHQFQDSSPLYFFLKENSFQTGLLISEKKRIFFFNFNVMGEFI